jgi:hypothetical protein
VCMYACMYVCAFRTIPPCDRYEEPAHYVLLTGVHVCVCMHVCEYVCMCVRSEPFLRAIFMRNLHMCPYDRCVQVCISYVCMCVPVRVYKYIHTFIHTYTFAAGTPLQNNTEELWCLLHFLDPINYSNIDVRDPCQCLP